MLTDRELADIGLSRVDLPRVFDPAFAADHVRRTLLPRLSEAGRRIRGASCVHDLGS